MGPLDYHYQIYDVTSSTTIDDGYTNNTYPSVNRITGLTPEHHYCVVITVDCSSSNFSTPYSGYTTLPSFTFDADYMMLTYEFTDGSDLDTRSGIVVPNIGQTTQDKFLGWSCSSVFPTSGTPIITWGGDNTGTGFESVLIDMNAFKTAHPTDHTMVVDLRAFWYGTQGYNLVNVAGTLWKGGTPVKSGYLWTNPTKTDQLLVASVGKQITLKPLTNKNKSAGQRLATLTYNVTTGIGSFNINDTTTPQITDLP
jgi:hypothetical protein